ncbi:MAG: OsmC family peroxiredoxin [Acidimicrobiales bacterium]
MATTRTADAHWEGTLLEGNGTVTLVSSGTGAFDVTWASRAQTPEGRTSPEELIAAAHAACFSMALSSALAKGGTPATTLDTSVEVDFQPGEGIVAIRITVAGDVPGLSGEAFAGAATAAKENCPVSQALRAVPIALTVR